LERLENSKKKSFKEDSSLKTATFVNFFYLKKIKGNKTKDFIGERVELKGWCHRIREQKTIKFVVLRDGIFS
jgi:hypothetical protein